MLFKNKAESLIWESDAEALMKKIPPFVVPLVRKAAEREARKRETSRVTGALLLELARRFSPHGDKKFKLQEAFASKTENPLYDSFPESTLTNGHGEKLKDDIPEDQYDSAWKRATAQEDDREETALYIHTPFCATRCKYCGFFVNGSNPEMLDRYTAYLVRELRMLLRTEGIGNRRFDCVYFGGGTPSDFSAKNLETILTVVREFQLSADCEITLEGRVSSLQNDKIAVCRNFGVNRYSLGVQSFNTGLRRAMGRISTRKEVIAALQNLRKTADAAVVIDQIYGLPGQNMNMWLEDLDTLFDECPVSGVDHYPLIRMPGTPLDHAVMAGALATPPDARLRADMFNTALDRMKDHDVHRASLKHFAFSPQERNRYNRLQAYGGCCVPAGCGGGGNIGGYFFYQAGSLENYFQAIDLGKKPLTLVSEVSDEERFLNTLSGEILTRCGFSLSTLQRHFQLSLDLEQCLHPLLKQYDKSGLLSVDNNGSVFLTRAGQFWNNAIFQNLKKLYLTTVKQEKK